MKKEFQEQGVSGFKVSANDRDAVQELKSAAEKKEFDILLVFMFDRIGRIDNETPFVVEWFIQHGIEVWSVNEGEQRMDSHVDKLMNYIRFWQANGESQKTSMRVKTRLHQLVEDGIYTGGCAPFGYKLVKSGVVNKRGKELMTLEQEPREVVIVRTIFEKTVKDGYGSYVMAEYINDRKILTHNGSKFQSNTIKRILQNSIYCGFYVRGGVTSKRIEELQIIDDDIFDQAQKILEQRKYTNNERTQISRTAKSSTMLGGNIYCAHCGKKLCANSFVDKYTTKDGTVHNGGRRFRYLCSGKAMNRNECDGQSVYTASKVDEVVIAALHKCFDKIKVTPKDAAIEKKYKTQITQIKQEIKKLERETDTLKRKLG
ncbi:MAG: recombinase family protein, partial [Ruminococcus sp.]|nr:recombinase family protein [Ruminococcus sp.]